MKKPKITKATLFEVRLPLKEPFTTGFGTLWDRDTLLVRLEDESGIIGWGEAALVKDPIYLEEWLGGGWLFITNYLFPIINNQEITSQEFADKIKHLRGNNIAKFAVETALWSIEAQLANKPVWQLLGGTRTKIQSGASISIQENIDKTLEKVEKALDRGLTRIKLKIKPGLEYQLVKAVREKFPEVMLMADANSSYTLADVDKLKALDEFNLIMIEQPLAYDDIIDHAKLAKQIKTPICLDESIRSFEDARKAIELKACKIINVKPARVASLYEVQKINQLAKKTGIQLWCGGMLESDIGLIANLASASLSEFTLPADISNWTTYFDSTFTNINDRYNQGIFTLDDAIGLDLKVDEEWLENKTIRKLKI